MVVRSYDRMDARGTGGQACVERTLLMIQQGLLTVRNLNSDALNKNPALDVSRQESGDLRRPDRSGYRDHRRSVGR